MAEYEFTEEGVTAALDVLGDTSEQVAQALRARGIQGSRGMCSTCPIAVYLAGLFPGSDVDVNRERVLLHRRVMPFVDGNPAVEVETVEVETPDPAADFIGDYDDLEHLRYRFLERTTP